MSTAGPRRKQTIYLFAEVELDPVRRRLLVDRQNVACPPKVLELLTMLAERPGEPVSREALYERLWPGGQVVSDEALTQLVFRARAVLGRHASLLRTIRGHGFLLEADVRQALVGRDDLQSEPAAAAAADDEVAGDRVIGFPGRPRLPLPSSPVDHSPGGEPAGSGRAASKWQALALLAVLLASAAGYFLIASEPVMVDAGYGIARADVGATREDTIELLAEALGREEQGERARAIALLEAVHASDAGTPLPALMIALWQAGTGNGPEAARWLQAAGERMGMSDRPFQRVFHAYVAAEVAFDPDRIIATAGAVLDLRPDAWRMRHARAHLLDFRGRREAALAELGQIDFPGLGHRKRDQIIADLASLGDIPRAQAILDALAGDPDRATWLFLSGRIAWSRDDLPGAASAFAHAASTAVSAGRWDLEIRSLIYLAATEVRRGGRDDAAVASLERARSLLGDGRIVDELDITLFLAGLHAEAGLTALRDAELAHARELLRSVLPGDHGAFANFALLRLDPQAEPPPLDPGASDAIQSLWLAARRFHAGDREGTREALETALNRGIVETRYWDEARWLQAALGLTVGEEKPIDPPYPPLSRVLLRRQLATAAAAAMRDGVTPSGAGV